MNEQPVEHCRARGATTAFLILALVIAVSAARADEPYARSRDYDLQHSRIALRFNLGEREIIGDVNRRRGQVTEQGQKGNQATVQGFVPLSEMFGYINFLRSATSGRGTFTMEFAHYAEVPAGLVQKLMEAEA